jgi:hypothetical protein
VPSVSDSEPDPVAEASSEPSAAGSNSILSVMSAREILTVFTAGWLGGLGLLSLISAHQTWPGRLLGLVELCAAVLWFVPRYRVSGYGAMLAVLVVAALRQVIAGQLPGALVFYAAVVVYLAFEDGWLRPEAGAPRAGAPRSGARGPWDKA